MSKITLLDGGMGQELIKRSGGVATPLWSTQALLDRPGLIGEVHHSYADAGASIATTNTYALHKDRLRGSQSNHYAADGDKLPDLEDQHAALVAKALDEAEKVGERVRIAGSIGPLVASYRSDLNPEFDAAVAQYAEMAHLLAPRVDLILFETIASLEAAQTCLAAGRQTDRPVWLSFTVDDEDGSLLRSGEPVAEAAKIAQEADAALANCSAPEAMAAAIEALTASGQPVGAYANGFTQITKAFLEGGTTANDLSSRRDMGPERYADLAMSWVDHGASIIGGCCEVGPAHIAEIAGRLKASGHEIV